MLSSNLGLLVNEVYWSVGIGLTGVYSGLELQGCRKVLVR